MSRRGGALEEMLVGFFEVPLWMSIAGAIFIFLTFQFVLPLFAEISPTGKLLGEAFSTLAPWAAGAILVAGLAGAAWRRFRRLSRSGVDDLEKIRRLDWRGFEALVGDVYRKQGYSVVERGGKQADGGVDLELHRGSETILVQCKHWTHRQVPVQRVRELLGVVSAAAADRGILISTSGFTSEAQAFAAGQPIELLDGRAFATLTRSANNQSIEREPSLIADAQAPNCPQCGCQMVQRTARRGPNAGSSFWGCPAYPRCRGIRAA
jgi:restriction system protein